LFLPYPIKSRREELFSSVFENEKYGVPVPESLCFHQCWGALNIHFFHFWIRNPELRIRMIINYGSDRNLIRILPRHFC
jgi:hypothetical protein